MAGSVGTGTENLLRRTLPLFAEVVVGAGGGLQLRGENTSGKISGRKRVARVGTTEPSFTGSKKCFRGGAVRISGPRQSPAN